MGKYDKMLAPDAVLDNVLPILFGSHSEARRTNLTPQKKDLGENLGNFLLNQKTVNLFVVKSKYNNGFAGASCFPFLSGPQG